MGILIHHDSFRVGEKNGAAKEVDGWKAGLGANTEKSVLRGREPRPVHKRAGEEILRSESDVARGTSLNSGAVNVSRRNINVALSHKGQLTVGD